MTKEEKQEIRQFLAGYRALELEIKGREKELVHFAKSLQNPLQIIQGADQTGKTVVRLQQIHDTFVCEMQIGLDKLAARRKRIECAIEQLDGYERTVCFYRYIMGVYWIDLPEHVGYEVAQCQRIEGRALEKIARYLKYQADDKSVRRAHDDQRPNYNNIIRQ